MHNARSIPVLARNHLALLLICAFTQISAARMSGQVSSAPPLLPNGIAYDAAGNLYFADTNRHLIYESSLAGVLTIVAGNGVQGSSGDGGPSTSAELNSPEGIAIGSDGTIYIADTGNQRIRALKAGQIVAFAGNGTSGFSGDGGSAIAAALNRPNAIALDSSGALLLCDSLNHRVRRISGGTIATLAGNGTQGFAGDGGLATASELDTPSGVAVGPDGRIFIADAHNNRIRVVATDGTIETFAGTGLQGYSGDGGAATAARLAYPRGLYLTPSGALLVADANNQRLRMIDAMGTITTIAGSGVQGNSRDPSAAVTAALDTPRAVALSSFGSPVISDAGNQTVRERLVNGSLYLPAGLASGRVTTVSLTQPSDAGSSVMVTAVGPAGIPQGGVQLLEGKSVVAHGVLAAGAATLTPSGLDTGPHTLVAAFTGDGVNPAAMSNNLVFTVTQLVANATANAVVSDYGAAIPALTGSLTGVLPADAGNVAVVFSSTAIELDPPGIYPITASLTGSASAKYALVLNAASGSVEIVRAPTLTAEQPLAQSSYEGLPLILTAGVISTTQGTPSGIVTFSDGANIIGTGTLTDGIASATFLSPNAGSHSITASYGGDADFAASTAQVVKTVVGAMPDFTLLAGNATQSVGVGGSVSYTITVGANPSPFTGVVSLSESGAPAGWIVTFSPPQTVPGAGTAVVTMSVQTATSSAGGGMYGIPAVLVGWMIVPLCLFLKRRRGSKHAPLLAALLLVMCCAYGCGSRSVTTTVTGKQTYSLRVTGTSTNLAGTLVTHFTTVTLIVQ